MEKETNRIESFSDGVFSIAITLLVLGLHVPPFHTLENEQALTSYLLGQWPSYLAFTLSFASIFIMWVNHHKLFKQIYIRNNAIMFTNGLILFLVSIASYPTALLAGYYNGDVANIAVAIYTGLFLLINLAYNLLWYVASHHRKLLRPDITEEAIRKVSNTYLYGIPAYLAAFMLSFCYPTLALAICVILWIFWACSSGRLRSAEE